jgi:hypothetical protein
MMKKFLMVLVLVLFAIPAFSIPQQIYFQGILLDDNDEPVSGAYVFTFRIYDASAGGTELWEETHTSVQVSNGLYTVKLGSVDPLNSSVFDGDTCYIGVQVDTDAEMSPRIRLLAVPYAYRAGAVDDSAVTEQKLADSAVTTTKIADGNVTEAKLDPAIDFNTSGSGNYGGDLSVAGKLTVGGVIDPTAIIIEPTDIATKAIQVKNLSGNDVFVYSQAGGMLVTNEAAVKGGNYARLALTNYAGDFVDVLNGTAVRGTSSSGNTGSLGLASGGVRGYAFSAGGTGGYFESSSTTGRGVSGRDIATTGINYGGYFQSNSSAGIGAYAYAFNSSGTALVATNEGGERASLGTPTHAGHFIGDVTVEGDVYADNFYGTYFGDGSNLSGVAASGNYVELGRLSQQTTTSANAVYVASSNNTGIGIKADATATGAYTNYGGYFGAAGEIGRGIYAEATETGSFVNFGGEFIARGDSGRGVRGLANSTAATQNYGGHFIAAGEYGRGVFGQANATTNTTNYGGFFQADGVSGKGVYGAAIGNTGVGVQGQATQTGNYVNYGGSFTASGDQGQGVAGYASATSGTNYGGYFTAQGDTARGVYGAALSTASGQNYGGYFYAGGTSGIGVYAIGNTYAAKLIGDVTVEGDVYANSFYGDGSNLTGLPSGFLTTAEGDNRYVNVSGDTMTGDLILSGSAILSVDNLVTVEGQTFLNGRVYIGDSALDDVIFNSEVDSDLIPGNAARNLGSFTDKWLGIYGQNLYLATHVSVETNSIVAAKFSTSNGSGIAVVATNESGSGNYAELATGTDAGIFGGDVTVYGTIETTGTITDPTGNTVEVTDGLYVWGDLNVAGNLSKGSGSFAIDHPLDPSNKVLRHSFVESPDMKNVYDGVIALDEKGEAIVTLPDYFEALNVNFRYQLTTIGDYAPVYIKEKISDNKFKIAGGKPGMEVSWLVTGSRCDVFALDRPIIVEEEKAVRGTYLYPAGFNKRQAAK